MNLNWTVIATWILSEILSTVFEILAVEPKYDTIWELGTIFWMQTWNTF